MLETTHHWVILLPVQSLAGLILGRRIRQADPLPPITNKMLDRAEDPVSFVIMFFSSPWSGFFPRLPAVCEPETPKGGTVSTLMNSVGLGGLIGKVMRSPTESNEQCSFKNATSLASAPSSPGTSSRSIPPADSIPSVQPSSSDTSEGTMTPVQYEQYAREYMQITGQDNFDGFRLEASKQVTPQLQTSHSLFLGTTMREQGYVYQFGPTFALEDGKLFFMGRYGNDATMTGRMLKKVGASTEARVSVSSSLESEQRNMLEVAVDRSGIDWAGSLKTAWQGTWIFNTTFSQIVTPRLQMGGDLTYIMANGASIGSVGLRYRNGDGIFSAGITRQPNFKSPTGLTQNVHSCKVQYYRKGYEYLFRQARIQGLLDTAGKVSVCAQDATDYPSTRGTTGIITSYFNVEQL